MRKLIMGLIVSSSLALTGCTGTPQPTGDSDYFIRTVLEGAFVGGFWTTRDGDVRVEGDAQEATRIAISGMQGARDAAIKKAVGDAVTAMNALVKKSMQDMEARLAAHTDEAVEAVGDLELRIALLETLAEEHLATLGTMELGEGKLDDLQGQLKDLDGKVNELGESLFLAPTGARKHATPSE